MYHHRLSDVTILESSLIIDYDDVVVKFVARISETKIITKFINEVEEANPHVFVIYSI